LRVAINVTTSLQLAKTVASGPTKALSAAKTLKAPVNLRHTSHPTEVLTHSVHLDHEFTRSPIQNCYLIH